MLYYPTVSTTYATQHEGQTLNLYLTGKQAPSDGYAVLVLPSLATFNTSTPLDVIRPALPNALSRMAYRWLAEGKGAVVTTTMTVSRGGATGNPVDGGDYGAAYDGNGLYLPPGHESGAWEDPGRAMPQKDIWYIRDWIAQHAKEYGLDNGQVFGIGGSAGAVCLGLAVYGPDQREALGLTSRVGELTWAGIHLSSVPTRFRTMDQTSLGWMFPSKASPGANWDQPAATLADTEPTFQDALSFLTFDTGTSVPLYAASASASEGASFVPPYSDDLTTDFHSLDFLAMLRLARSVKRITAYADDVALTGYEDAVYEDTANDDDSEYVADVVDFFTNYLSIGDPAMGVGQFAAPTIPLYNSVTSYSGTTVAHDDWEIKVPAGGSKYVIVQNVDVTADSAMRVAIANESGAVVSQFGFLLGPLLSTTLTLAAPNLIALYTGGRAVAIKHQTENKAVDYHIVAYA